MLGIYWLADKWLASQEGLCCMEYAINCAAIVRAVSKHTLHTGQWKYFGNLKPAYVIIIFPFFRICSEYCKLHTLMSILSCIFRIHVSHFYPQSAVHHVWWMLLEYAEVSACSWVWLSELVLRHDDVEIFRVATDRMVSVLCLCKCNCNCNLFSVHKSNLGYSPVDVDIVINISSNIVFIES